MLTEQQKKEVIEQLSETKQMARLILQLSVPGAIPGPVTVLAIGLSAMKILNQTEAIANKIKKLEQRKEDAANKGVPKYDNPPSPPTRSEEGTVKNGEAPKVSKINSLSSIELSDLLMSYKALLLEFKERGHQQTYLHSLIADIFNK